MGKMSQVEPAVSDEVVALDAEDRVWLDERLREYRDLLVYLHDH
jgi:predicted nucleic acid-binding Zn ribbon protein